MSNTVQFWLSFNNGEEKLRLPVNPEMVSVSTDFDFNDVSVAKLGEFTVIGENQLDEFSFDSFFPKNYHPGYCEYEGFPTPRECVDTLKRWRSSRRPIRFVVTGTDINEAVTLRDFDYDEVAFAQNGDIEYSITLKEFPFVKFRQIEQPTVSVSEVKKEPKRENPKPQPKTYTVKRGDSLWKIAASNLGNGNRWRELYNLNKSVIGKNPDLIFPGQRLKLPS